MGALYELKRNSLGLTQMEVSVLEAYIPPTFSKVAADLGFSNQKVGRIAKQLLDSGDLIRAGRTLQITEEGRKRKPEDESVAGVLNAFVPPSLSEIGERLGCSKQRVGEIAKKHRADGYLTKNGQMLVVTDEGRRAAGAKKGL